MVKKRQIVCFLPVIEHPSSYHPLCSVVLMSGYSGCFWNKDCRRNSQARWISRNTTGNLLCRRTRLFTLRIKALKDLSKLTCLGILKLYSRWRVCRIISANNQYRFWRTAVLSHFVVKLMELKLLRPPLAWDTSKGPYQCLRNLRVYIWKKRDRSFPKFGKNPKHLHVFTNSKLWSWKKNFLHYQKLKTKTSINHATGETEWSFHSLHRKWYCKSLPYEKGVKEYATKKCIEIILEVCEAAN